MNIGQEIIILRGSKGWTQQELAEKLQTTPRTIGAWESGASIPRNAMKVKIAEVFGLPKDYFLLDETETEETIEKQQREEIQDVMEKLNQVLSNSENLISEEQKKECLESCYKVLSETSEK